MWCEVFLPRSWWTLRLLLYIIALHLGTHAGAGKLWCLTEPLHYPQHISYRVLRESHLPKDHSVCIKDLSTGPYPLLFTAAGRRHPRAAAGVTLCTACIWRWRERRLSVCSRGDDWYAYSCVCIPLSLYSVVWVLTLLSVALGSSWNVLRVSFLLPPMACVALGSFFCYTLLCGSWVLFLLCPSWCLVALACNILVFRSWLVFVMFYCVALVSVLVCGSWLLFLLWFTMWLFDLLQHF